MSTRYDPEDVDMLSDYECPECGPMVEDGVPICEPDEILTIFGGDANGIMRCPNWWCDEELELTVEAAIDALKMIAERMPDLASTIADQLEGQGNGT